MLRSPVSILLFVVCPIVVSSVLISAFSSMMESYKNPEDFEVGYMADDDERSSEYVKLLGKIGTENGITFSEYSGDIEEAINSHGLGGFVTISKDGYKVYKSEDKKTEGAKLEYMLSAVFNSMISPDQGKVSYVTETPKYAPAINSADYYGIVFAIYFGWCAIVCGAGLFTNEKKNSIIERLQVSNLSVFQIYLARIIPIIIIVTLGTAISAVFMSLVMAVNWGNVLLSALIVMLSVVTATAFEMMIYEITNSMIATIIITFGVVWFMGFVGGTFEPYMFSDYSDTLKQMSPLYHANRSLTELSSMGHSNYVLSTIVYSVAMTAVCSCVSLFAGRIRRAGK